MPPADGHDNYGADHKRNRRSNGPVARGFPCGSELDRAVPEARKCAPGGDRCAGAVPKAAGDMMVIAQNAIRELTPQVDESGSAANRLSGSSLEYALTGAILLIPRSWRRAQFRSLTVLMAWSGRNDSIIAVRLRRSWPSIRSSSSRWFRGCNRKLFDPHSKLALLWRRVARISSSGSKKIPFKPAELPRGWRQDYVMFRRVSKVALADVNR